MSITQSNKRKTQKRTSQLQSKPSQISSGKSFMTALKAAIKKMLLRLNLKIDYIQHLH